MSGQSIYVWRKRSGEFGVDEVHKLKEVESENTWLRKLLIERELEPSLTTMISMFYRSATKRYL